jgi:protein TonB
MHRYPSPLKCAASIAVLAILTACHPTDPQVPTVKSTEVMAIDTPPPDYPLEQACSDVGGKVTMKVVVGPEGRATEVRVLNSSGVQVLDQAAQDAVRAWEFKPATRNGQPVSQTIQVPMSFTPTPESELCLERDPNQL